MNQTRRALSQYQEVGIESSILEADPHAVIQQLMQGVIECLSTAKGAMQRNDVALKAKRITHAIRIIDGLRAHLDHEKGGEIAENLDALYDYMSRRLVDANAKNDLVALDEAFGLMMEIKSGWDAIDPDRNKEAVAS
ncbi:flagellar export chaperone FliS [Acidihalobacter ferrooxydans]|uniref:Flagellar secretion chaperone FliS n=1 Tax=Acidihalobacter ferrooxydans TaxID=1765967 RepID=A0A1P8UL86_9GAMM|nr:flagellar export chaperone FliS [Acidihalobacter ferrooxydans]APZ44608.1 flagellar export chaperone FliS [Acidihalobacter ferrooxydans]